MPCGLDTLCIVPACGLHELTHAVVRQLLAEDVDVLVVDGAGDYQPLGRERLLRPGNRGWLGAANLGLAHGFARGYARVLLLNNDVQLSREFVRGLVAAAGPGVALVGPLADDVDLKNGQLFRCDPAHFVPYDLYLARQRPPEDRTPADHAAACTVDAKFVHGSCMLWTAAGYAAIGPMDEAQQPYGWGTDVESGHLARLAGLRVVISKRSHLRHVQMATVKSLGHDPAEYGRRAAEHTRGVFRARYGARWQETLGFDFGVAP